MFPRNGVFGVLAVAMVATAVQGQEAANQVLFTKVSVWDGRANQLAAATDVLVEGNHIKQVAKGINPPKGLEATRSSDSARSRCPSRNKRSADRRRAPHLH